MECHSTQPPRLPPYLPPNPYKMTDPSDRRNRTSPFGVAKIRAGFQNY